MKVLILMRHGCITIDGFIDKRLENINADYYIKGMKTADLAELICG